MLIKDFAFYDKNNNLIEVYQLENENTPLEKGTGYRLVENLLKINNYFILLY